MSTTTRLSEAVACREASLVALRRDLHRHPELAFAERRTAALVADRLARAGLAVQTGIGGTGLVAVLDGDRPGRTVAWRADMDALPLDEAVPSPFASTIPGVMHACGHDGHTAIAVVAAELLAAWRAALPGRVVFVFQPAEEILAGARQVLESGVLDRLGVEAIYGLHLTSRLPVGVVELVPGVSMASADFLDIEISGRGGHGATPHLTIDPITVAAQIIVGLPQIVRATVPAGEAAVFTVGQILAGTAPNVVPETALLRGSLRALRQADRLELIARITAYGRAVAEGHRARAEVVRTGECCPPLSNDADATLRARQVLAGELGAGAILDGGPVLASDDMSLLLERLPGCYLRVGAAPEGRPAAPHHSPHFDLGEGSLAIGVRAAASILRATLVA